MSIQTSPSLLPIDGIRLASTRAIKAKNRDDLTAVEIAAGAAVAGVFTRNRFPAPPVEVCRAHLHASAAVRGLLINAGIANAGTLARGHRDARHCCRLFAKFLRCRSEHILPFSTGVIMEPLPMARYAAGLQRCTRTLAADNWPAAARAIMTTDTTAKGACRTVTCGKKTFTVTGIAKGSGMIHPNMATMLAFVATDAAVSARRLGVWQRAIVADTFNAISVDGDTSTNDSFVLIATGKAGACRSDAMLQVRQAVAEVCSELAEAIVRDGEGATKLVTICVRGGASRAVCRRVAESIARSPLVKTALAAGDANVGRFLMAAGNAGGGFNPQSLTLDIGGAPVIKNGGLHPRYNEQKTAAALAGKEVLITLGLGDGGHSVTLKTCDLTQRYIEINADYRS